MIKLEKQRTDYAYHTILRVVSVLLRLHFPTASVLNYVPIKQLEKIQLPSSIRRRMRVKYLYSRTAGDRPRQHQDNPCQHTRHKLNLKMFPAWEAAGRGRGLLCLLISTRCLQAGKTSRQARRQCQQFTCKRSRMPVLSRRIKLFDFKYALSLHL